MRIALTAWDGRISPVFDVCREAVVLDVDQHAVRSRSRVALDPDDPQVKIRQLVELGVETVICGAISEPLQHELNAHGIDAIGFVAGELAEVVQAYLVGGLPDASLAMPGCCGRQNRLRKGQGPRRRGGQRRRRRQGR